MKIRGPNVALPRLLGYPSARTGTQVPAARSACEPFARKGISLASSLLAFDKLALMGRENSFPCDLYLVSGEYGGKNRAANGQRLRAAKGQGASN